MDSTPLRLLIIDDSDDDAVILLRDLRVAGYKPLSRRVHSAAGLQEALDSQPWDLAVCDYRMPGFSGASALSQVKAHSPRLPFVFLSGNLPPNSAETLAQADAFVSKDNPKDLLQSITSLIARGSNSHDS